MTLGFYVVFFLFFSGDVITRRHTVEMAEQYRDQLAKSIYGRLFYYLANSINDYLQGQDDSIGYVLCVFLLTITKQKSQAIGSLVSKFLSLTYIAVTANKQSHFQG